MAIEGDAQHGYGGDEGDIAALQVLGLIGLVDGPNHTCYQKDDVDNLARVERHSQGVHEKQFKPAAHTHNARHHSIEHCCQDNHRDAQCDERTTKVGIACVVGIFTVVIYQHDGRQTKQVEQVHANGKSCHVHDEHQPAVAVRLVGVLVPLEYQPEHHGGKGRGVGIYLALYGTEPEGVAEGVYQGTHQGSCLNGDYLSPRQFVGAVGNQSASEM